MLYYLSLKDSFVQKIPVRDDNPFASFFFKHISFSNLGRVQQISAPWLQNTALQEGVMAGEREGNKRETDREKGRDGGKEGGKG